MRTVEAQVEITIPFHDIDSIGVAWHGHYAKYFEIARCEMLDSFGYGYDAMRASGFMWPVIDMRIRYVKPVRFGQRVLVKATLREWENRLLIDYLVSDRESGQRLTKGTTVQVAVDMSNGEMCFVSPPVLFERLGLQRA
ncbi:acyl-CoA thioester hydrolase [Povalibacter uvarum]|uniref:Acyl-CoA thioester hydrolase n=1 Tax=Povalibacter uvarum TaxID=732238 RepID=A0A841HMT7_9GAMM|nr:thioesterase family protein [Povalibacter uvarum]MBB6093392.1 acyl-CoA thioester hydrolase [Povalibacter uvarum]